MIRFTVGDITGQAVDAIVNAANSSLLGGGGVDGAIHSRGGPQILEECRHLRATILRDGLATGRAIATTAGDLPAKRVIHTVGPVWHGCGAGEAALLRSAYQNSLRVAVEEGLHTVAFPSISTGAYGYPTDRAAAVAIDAVLDFQKTHTIDVTFVLYSQRDFDTYRAAYEAAVKDAD
jgi:O-acetyl-ADP-ribose deacetylase (regulator of RNase III)